MASSDPGPDERDVFSGLPNTRPQRRSAKRDHGTTGDGGAPEAAKAPAGAKRAQAPRTRKTAKPEAAAQPKPSVPPAGYATPNADDRPHGTDLIGTAFQAAGELAHIGIVFSARALKSAIQRLPRP